MIPYNTNQVPLTSAVREPNPYSPPSLRFPAQFNVLERRRQHAPVSRVEELFHYFSAIGDVNSLLSTS